MDSDTDDEYEVPVWKGVPGNIVLINVFDPLQQNTPFVAHKATCEMVRQYLRTSTSQYVGVCLYGVMNSDSSVIEVIPLNVPTLKNFKILQGLDLSTVSQAIDLKLSDVLRHCSKMFRQCKKQFSTQTVTILTNLRTPPTPSDQKATLNSVKDLVDSNIDIKIINVSENDYKIDQFYEDFLIEANKGEHDFILPKPIWDCKEIERVIHQQSHRHLVVSKLDFEIGENVCIGVGVYRLLKSTGQPYKKSDLDRDTNAVVTRVTETMKVTISDVSPMDVDEQIESKQDPVLNSELLYYQQYGGEKIEFTKDEKKKLANPFGPPMLKLLGFKPSNLMCKERWYLKSSYFIFPSESKVEGSTVAFKALHKACSEMSVVAICVLCTRANSKHKIVALSPSMNPLNLDIDIGFDVIHIPFVENKRDLSVQEDEEENVSEADKRVMKDILNNLKFDYKTDMSENPTQQFKIRAIEAIALDMKDVDHYVDTTTRDSDVFEGIDVNLFEEIFGPFGTVTNKRTAQTMKANTSNKRTKIEDIDETLLEDRINNKTVNKYTNTELKQILKSKNIPIQSRFKKEDLVNLVYEHCG